MAQSSTKPFSGIFVSYRRDDSSGHAGRLFDKLVNHFGKDRIFMDIDTIEPGEDFVTVVENAVGSCDILIAIIGRNWLSGTSENTRALDNPNDFVRLEISTALSRNIRVIPVLVQRASMPKPEDLPNDLAKFTRRNAVELSDLRWQNDVDQLIGVMERVLAKRGQSVPPEERQRQEKEKKRRVEEEKRLRLAEEASQRAAEEVERPRGEQALHASRKEEHSKPHLSAVAIRDFGHPAQPPESRASLGTTEATPGRQDRSKRTMLLVIIACFVILACVAVLGFGALIWMAQTPGGEQPQANHNPTPETTQRQTTSNNNSNRDVPFRSETAIREIHMAKDEGGQPGDQTDVFEPGDRTIHCVAKLKESKSGTNVRFSWWIVDANGARNRNLKNIDYKTSALENIVQAHLTLPQDWPRGKYKVQVYVDGDLGGTINYSVE